MQSYFRQSLLSTKLLVVILLLSACGPKDSNTATMQFSAAKMQQVKTLTERASNLLNKSVQTEPEYHFTTIFKAQDLLAEAKQVLMRANIEDPNNQDIQNVALKLKNIRTTLALKNLEYLRQNFSITAELIAQWRKETRVYFQNPNDTSYNNLLNKIELATQKCCRNKIYGNLTVIEEDQKTFYAVSKLSNQIDSDTKKLIAKEISLEDIFTVISNVKTQLQQQNL